MCANITCIKNPMLNIFAREKSLSIVQESVLVKKFFMETVLAEFWIQIGVKIYNKNRTTVTTDFVLNITEIYPDETHIASLFFNAKNLEIQQEKLFYANTFVIGINIRKCCVWKNHIFRSITWLCSVNKFIRTWPGLQKSRKYCPLLEAQ